MYRHGLGDCILLTLRPVRRKPVRILIDCGVYQTTPGGKQKMRDVVADLVTVTGGVLDIVVATHEHFDHISGFSQAADLFAAANDAAPGKLRTGQVWMGWTDDPNDALARDIGGERNQALAGVEAATALAQALSAGTSRRGDTLAKGLGSGLNSILGFFPAAPGGSKVTMNALRAMSRTPVRYCRPDDAPWSDIPGVRIYALGPPRDRKAIFRLMDEKEVYAADHDHTPPGDDAFVKLLKARADAAPDRADPDQPFDVGQRIPLGFGPTPPAVDSAPDGEIPRFFAAHYFGASADAVQPDQQWRRIDADWLGPASDLALKLDNATNNTSLVLAVELVASGKVLLFPGDAQVGSWLTWGGLTWTLPGGQVVTGEDLLRRTAFYKVGHHGSHNATLKAKGVELMQRDDLVAFIPVDEVMAKKVNWGSMPLPSIEKALDDRASGRVVRTDRVYSGATLAPGDDFNRRLRVTDLAYEVDIDG
jgi:hypothetical protein